MRIAIVNDTLMAVEAIRRVLATVADYQIAWVAYNGLQAVRQCARDCPDLVLMDLLMPVMDGVEATHQIMSQSPCAIVVVTASVNAQASKVFEAMGYGALDAVNLPILGVRGQADNGAKLLAKIAIIGKLLGKSPRRQDQMQPAQKGPVPSKPVLPLIVIGASTGGPRALKAILSNLPKNFSAAVAIVQHIDVQFAPGLVQWLNDRSPVKVELARDGGRFEAGKALLAGTNDHLILRSDLTLTHTKEPQDCFYRPSVDVFFSSVAKYWPGSGVGVLLTGMGKDGAQGLYQLRCAGWHTIVQNQASCVVYGMPKAAVELGAAAKILPIDGISAALVNLFVNYF
ncbi:chemotaxis response regulator protein-glutamate methylesterase [Microcoleus sp. FACHB-672]|nr:chemotaxis response regulator protein-glutamate methylesterase [Microcoleus sp. FACHB-672]